MKTARQVFKSMSVNPMTPDTIQILNIGMLGVELAVGTDFQNNPIWGVTVVNRQTEVIDHKRSNLFYSEKEARDYIDSLA